MQTEKPSESSVFLFEPKADDQAAIYSAHHGIIQMTNLFFQPLFIDGADLLQQDDRIFGQGIFSRGKGDMGWQLCLIHLGGDGGTDDGRAVFVAYVILHDENGADAPLFAAHHRAQVCKINISTSDDHRLTLRCLDWSAAEEKYVGFECLPC